MRDDEQPRRGQALAEFALTIPIFALVFAGIIQLSLVMWSQNTVTQIARDTARWAVTQSTPCASTRGEVASAATILADRAALIGFTPAGWSAPAPPIASLDPNGVGVDWQSPDSELMTDCPPSDNQTVWTVRVRVNHVVPIFVPFMDVLAPSCTASGWCISSETELRMEPKKR